jgi:hypothetical protein
MTRENLSTGWSDVVSLVQTQIEEQEEEIKT